MQISKNNATHSGGSGKNKNKNMLSGLTDNSSEAVLEVHLI